MFKGLALLFFIIYLALISFIKKAPNKLPSNLISLKKAEVFALTLSIITGAVALYDYIHDTVVNEPANSDLQNSLDELKDDVKSLEETVISSKEPSQGVIKPIEVSTNPKNAPSPENSIVITEPVNSYDSLSYKEKLFLSLDRKNKLEQEGQVLDGTIDELIDIKSDI